MMSRRAVLRALGSVPFLSLIPAVARASIPAERLREINTAQCMLDYTSLARICLPVRIQKPSERGMRTPGLEGYTHLFQTAEQWVDVTLPLECKAATAAFIDLEESVFRDLLERGATRGTVPSLNYGPPNFQAMRSAIERHHVRADKLIVAYEDLAAHEKRWGSLYDRADQPELWSSGYRGSIMGIAVVARQGSALVKPGEALMVSVPEFLGQFYEVRPPSVRKTSGISQKWGTDFGVCVTPKRAVLVELEEV